MEVHDGAILSVNASLIPFSDHNPSPRNIYQCQVILCAHHMTSHMTHLTSVVIGAPQMGKQTIGIPGHAHMFRSDFKTYILQVSDIA